VRQAARRTSGALAEAARAVRDGSKLKLEQFTSESAFNTLRNFNTMLTSFIVEIVTFNIDEVEVHSAEMQAGSLKPKPSSKAGRALLKGDLGQGV
jgi:hypothetical protein